MTAPNEQAPPEAAPRRRYSPEAQAEIDRRRAHNALVAAINGTSWGLGLNKRQAGVFAEFMRRFRLDISEVDNLGGRPYRNGRYYMRRGAELTREGRLVAYFGEHIGPDARLAKIAADESATEGERAWARGEDARRERLRIIHAVPVDATHAYLVTLSMRVADTDKVIVTQGCKWYAPGRKRVVWKNSKQIEVSADPVGDANPDTSVETRAWRRAGRLAFAEIPELREEEAALELAADAVQEIVVEEAEAAEAAAAGAAMTGAPVDHGGDDPYVDGAKPRQLGEGAAQPISVKQGQRVASTVPDGPAHDDDYIDDTDLVD